MIIAVFSRILRSGVTVESLVEAWKPVGGGAYPADVEVAVDPENDRRVITIIRFKGSLEDFSAAMPTLVHPDSVARLEKLVETTELEAVYESVSVSL